MRLRAVGPASATVNPGVPYTQAELEAKIAAIETAMARGELRVDFADRSVTYRSTAELITASDYFKRLLTQLVTPTRSRQTVAVGSKGF